MEAMVRVLSAICENCGELRPISPDHEPVAVPLEEVRRKANLVHAPPGGCGGKVLLATEPVAPTPAEAPR